MRVRISYSTHIDEVPEEIDQMFTYVSSKSRKVMRQIEQLESLLADEDIEATSAIVDRLRTSLNEIDLRLADIQHISAGYLNYKTDEGVENVHEGDLVWLPQETVLLIPRPNNPKAIRITQKPEVGVLVRQMDEDKDFYHVMCDGREWVTNKNTSNT